jgi:hypothetical protein
MLANSRLCYFIFGARSIAMSKRRRVKPALSFFDRLKMEAQRLRQEAENKPPGPDRDELMTKVRQVESALRIANWVSSPGLKSPT